MSILEEVFEHASVKAVAIGLVASYVLFLIAKRITEERRIQALGGHTRYATTYAPFCLDMIVRTVYNTMKHKNLEGWRGFFERDGKGGYTVESRPAGLRIILTADVENIKAILASQFGDYGKGEPFHQDWKEFLGDSIFATDGDLWHASRQLIRPQFAKDRVSDLHIHEKHLQFLLENCANGGVKGVPGVANDNIACGRVFDVSDNFFRYTLDSATEFLLGKSVGSLHIPRQEFADAFGEVQRIQNLIARAGPVNKLVPRGNFRKGLKVINEFVDQYIDRVLTMSPEEIDSKTKHSEGYTFLHALAGFTRDRAMLRDQLVAVLLAGRDTTASTLSWTFYELARHPEAFKKLREEIISTLGTDQLPTYEDLKNMKYLQWVMNETLRIYPVVPFNVRMALKDTTLPRGGGPNGDQPFAVLKDTPVGYSPLVMQRRKDLYPPSNDPRMDPENFFPDRWGIWQPKPWQYIPFNGGPRLCVGQQFALTNMGYTIVRMLQRFDRLESFMPEGPNGSPVLKAEIVLQPGAGVHVAFWETKKQ